MNIRNKNKIKLPKIWLQNEKYELQNTKDGHENSKELGVTTTGNITSGSSTNCLWKLCVQVPWWLMMNEIKGMISFAMFYVKNFTGYILVIQIRELNMIYYYTKWFPRSLLWHSVSSLHCQFLSFPGVVLFCNGKTLMTMHDWQLVVVLTKG